MINKPPFFLILFYLCLRNQKGVADKIEEGNGTAENARGKGEGGEGVGESVSVPLSTTTLHREWTRGVCLCNCVTMNIYIINNI